MRKGTQLGPESTDDELAVEADRLLARGDPRGELMALQLARAQGRANKETLSRERALLKAYRNQWLGSLAGALKADTIHWERGFAVGCELKTAARGSLHSALGNPAWRSIRDLSFQARFGPDHEDIVPFLGHPAMRGLRGLYWVWPATVARLLEERVVPKLERLVLADEPESWRGYHRFGMTMLGVLYPTSPRVLRNLPRSVTTFMAQHGASEIALATIPQQIRTVIFLDPYSRPYGDPYGYRITFRRTKDVFDVAEVAVSARPLGPELEKALAGFKGSVVRSQRATTAAGERRPNPPWSAPDC